MVMRDCVSPSICVTRMAAHLKCRFVFSPKEEEMSDLHTKYFVRHSADANWVEVTKGVYDQAGIILSADPWAIYPIRCQLDEENLWWMEEPTDDYDYVTEDCGV